MIDPDGNEVALKAFYLTYTVDSLKRILQGYNVATCKHNKEVLDHTIIVCKNVLV